MNWGQAGTFTVNGKTLEHMSWGPPPSEAPTIVMLHEGLGCVALWRSFPEQLAAATGWGVLASSRAGYGQSDPVDLPRPLDFMTQEAMHAVRPVLDQAGVEQAILFGHSDGATISAIYAGSVQDMRVLGLILMAPHFFHEEMGLAEIARAREAFDTGDLRSRLAKYHADPEVAFRGWSEAWLDLDNADWNVADVIDYLRVPVLTIQGRGDAYGTHLQIEEVESRSYAPVDTVWLEDCGHAPHLEKPEETLAAAAEFAARLKRIEAEVVET